MLKGKDGGGDRYIVEKHGEPVRFIGEQLHIYNEIRCADE
jgi:hypothetical protein